MRDAYDRHIVITRLLHDTASNDSNTENVVLQELLREIRELRVQMTDQIRTVPNNVTRRDRTLHSLSALDLTYIVLLEIYVVNQDHLLIS